MRVRPGVERSPRSLRMRCESRLLAVWLKDVTFKPGTRNCKVTGGVLDPDPYTGQQITFDSKTIQIDHIVTLISTQNAAISAGQSVDYMPLTVVDAVRVPVVV
jgi:hypothetical protein